MGREGSLIFSRMRRDVLAKGEWDETWAQHAREEKQTAVYMRRSLRPCQPGRLGIRVDLPQVDLVNFRVQFVYRSRSGLASYEVARGRLVSLEGFSYSFRAKSEEWRDLQLVSQVTFRCP